MSSKTVKITNGKILNYTITADGYKTIYGSRLITDNTTITKNMIPSTDPNEVYSLGDRIGNIASFLCYFNSTNPETLEDKQYAVFVLDAQYRSSTSPETKNTELPLYPSSTLAGNTLESATYNTNSVSGLGTLSPTNFATFYYARNAATIIINNVVYQSQLPNVYECKKIWENRVFLDSKDPTLSDYQNRSLTNWNINGNSNNNVYSSTAKTSNYFWAVNNSGSISADYVSNRAGGILPVFEIPVN